MSLRLDQTLAALADPTRRELLARLARRPHRAGELARGFAISRPAICKHTRLLKKAGLIRAKQNGREQIYELAPSGNQAIEELIGTLQQVGRFWDTALDSFKRYAESKPEAEALEPVSRDPERSPGETSMRGTQIKGMRQVSNAQRKKGLGT